MNDEQREALRNFRAEHGKRWKRRLLAGWEISEFPGPLQQIRNQYGPSWLVNLKPSEVDGDDAR